MSADREAVTQEVRDAFGKGAECRFGEMDIWIVGCKVEGCVVLGEGVLRV